MEWKMSQPAEVPCWFFFGSLDRHRVYNIHKEELEHAAIGHLIEYQHCPLLDLDKITKFIQQLPGQIDPRKDKEWKYNKQKRAEINVGYHKEPAVIPISEEVYRIYLKRKL
jgi:hypothetical protein